MSEIHIERIERRPLSVPLIEPFTIATATVTATRAVLVEATLAGASAVGIGEAAALPGVTSEDQPELLELVASAASALEGATMASVEELPARLLELVPRSAVARAGVEAALLDAWGRAAGVPVHVLLTGTDGGGAARAPAAHRFVTDVTLPIAAPEHMSELATAWRARGFHVFKVKVGRDLDDDMRALAAIDAAVPGARFRLDANGGYDAQEAIELLEAVARRGLAVECFEQPCARADLDGMAEVARASAVPVVADESVRDADDLRRVIAARAASAINVKLAKTGSLVLGRQLAARARAEGLAVMCGAMVETRLGLTAMAHVVAALGGVDWVDLDTAMLLADDPFEGGYAMAGDEMRLTSGAGLDVARRPSCSAYTHP